MAESDPIITELMRDGAEYEIISQQIAGRNLRVFKNTPENLGQALAVAESEFSEAEFIISGKKRVTYEQFFTQARGLARYLISVCNITPGQSVAIAMKNSPEWMLAFIGVTLAGGVTVLVNSRGEGETMRYAVEDSDTCLVICDPKRADELQSAGSAAALLITDRDEWQQAIHCSASPCSASLSSTSVDFPQPKSDDIAAMFFTSGTTGRAKAAAISHRSLMTGIMNTKLAITAAFTKIAQSYNITLEELRGFLPQSSSLLVFPLFHVSGCTATFLSSLLTGGKLVLMERWDGGQALDLIAAEKISTLGGVPAMLWDVLAAAETSSLDLSSLRSISCGGQGLPLRLLEQLKARFPDAIFGAGYGMTEACGAVAQANGDMLLNHPTTSGQVLPMVDVRIVGEDGMDMPLGETGEIWVRGATIMQGYHNNAAANAASFHDDWYKTGDIGFLNADHLITISDRKTDMVISMGENIYCAEVERLLSQNPEIREVVTFGVPDARMGEKLIAYIYSHKKDLTVAALQEFAKENMAAYKIPQDFVISDAAFAHNAMGKVEKHKLRQHYLARQ